MQNTELRPLGAGEILDRAITLYVRRFAVIAAVIAIAVVPIMVITALLAPQSAGVWTSLAQLMAAAGDPAATRRAAETMARQNDASAGAFVAIVVTALIRLVMWCALVRIVATAYGGATATIGGAYGFAMRRFAALLVVALAFMMLGVFAMIPVIVLYVMVVFAVALLAAVQLVAGIVIGVVFGLVVIAAAVVAGSVIYMTFELASVAVLTETANPIEAIGIAFRRAFGRGMKRRTLAGGLVLLVVSQAGAIPLVAVAALVTALTHNPILYYAIFGAGTVLLEGVIATYVIVFAVDARVRREGYDLVLQGALAP